MALFDNDAGRPAPARGGSSGARAVPFPDLRGAGRDLAVKLGAYRGGSDVLVLAIARGGVEVGVEVARGLGLPLDLVLIRRLLAPRGPETAVCAVNVGGHLFLDEELPAPPAVPESGLDYFLADALEEFAHREQLCRGGRTAIDLACEIILLVDNGICTGSTVLAAIRALRAKTAARIIVAAPVSSPEGGATVEAVADKLICLAMPRPFGHVGLWYADFKRPEDEQISELLDSLSLSGP
jgi:putative phosphoribosyl transferase